MKKFKKLATLFCAAALSLSVCAVAASCTITIPATSTSNSTSTPDSTSTVDSSSTSDSSSASGSYQVAESTDELVVFTVTTDVMALSESTTMYDYMLRLQQLGQMTFEGSDSEYGFMLTAVNGTTTKFTADDYWAVYVDFKTLPDDETIYASEGYEWGGVYYSMTYTYGDKTLYGANYGVSGMPAVEGQTYALVLVH